MKAARPPRLAVCVAAARAPVEPAATPCDAQATIASASVSASAGARNAARRVGAVRRGHCMKRAVNRSERRHAPISAARSGDTLARMSAAARPTQNEILLGDNLELLPRFADGSFQLAYVDPPFNTGKLQERRTLASVSDAEGGRVGFGGRRYSSRLLARSSYRDSF